MITCKDCRYYYGGWCSLSLLPKYVENKKRICPLFEPVGG